MNMKTLSKKELLKRSHVLTHEIHNIREDYAEVDGNHMPQDVLDELAVLLHEFHEVRELLGKE